MVTLGSIFGGNGICMWYFVRSTLHVQGEVLNIVAMKPANIMLVEQEMP